MLVSAIAKKDTTDSESVMKLAALKIEIKRAASAAKKQAVKTCGKKRVNDDNVGD
jgi:hypothetical protein